MSTQTNIQTAINPAVAWAGWFCFRWWYRGLTAEGNIIKLEGHVQATNDTSACHTVEAIMRAEHPTVRWMQGREIEGNGVMFGPTVQKLKRKQNTQAEPRPGKSPKI